MTALAKTWQQGRPSLAGPAVVVALATLVANDHVFKQQYPGWVTGKLSDAAGLFVLGALLAWLLPRGLGIALGAAGLAFAGWKSELATPLIAAWNQTGLLPVSRVADLTDLLALPCLALGAWTVVRRRRPQQRSRRPRRLRDLAVALASLLAFTATSRLYTFELRDIGGARTVVYEGSPAQLAAMLEACDVEWHPGDTVEGEVGIYVEPEPWADGIYLQGALRETEGRTVLIFDEASAGFEPDDEAAVVDRSIAAIESCFDPPEVELPPAETRDAAHLLQGLEGAFVVLSGGRTLVHGPARAETRFRPASTFKIPNMLIALETGVADGPDFLIPWDGKKPEESHPGGPTEHFWARSWSRDHTLRTAIGDGVLWYFQEIARRVGSERMSAYVRRFGYGNMTVTGPIDRFWLDGPLEISAREQVEFLRRFLQGELGLSERTWRVAKDVLVLETSDRRTVAGKTGSVWLPSGRLLAWLVGYVEHGGEAHVFALNLDCPDFKSCDLEMRRRLALAILEDWEILPSSSDVASGVVP